MKRLFLFLSLFVLNFSYSQSKTSVYNLRDKLEDLKQFGVIQSCNKPEIGMEKNSLIRCFVREISSEFDEYFGNSNSDNKANRNDFYTVATEIRYDEEGNFLNYKVISKHGFNTELIKNTQKEALAKIDSAFNDLNARFLKLEIPAKNFNEENVGFPFFLSFIVKAKNNVIVKVSSNNDSNLLVDLNAYQNEEMLKNQYSYFYKKIEKYVPDFKKIAIENKIDKAFGHILFDIDENGIVKNIRIDRHEGDEVFGNFLIEKLKSNIESDNKVYEVGILKDGSLISKEYRMSFSYGYK